MHRASLSRYSSVAHCRCFSAWPKLESATGRARKRRQRVQATTNRPLVVEQLEDDDYLPYPRGQPWRILWPQAHEDPLGAPAPSSRSIPRFVDFQRTWATYKQSWEDGLRGVPSESKQQELDSQIQEGNGGGKGGSYINPEGISKTTSDNLDAARQEAQGLLKEAQDRTGIYSQADLRKVAADGMKLATECVKEFMGGYRQGRDQEVDKMLHEYFQNAEEEAKGNKAKDGGEEETPKRRRRKPKRAILRD